MSDKDRRALAQKIYSAIEETTNKYDAVDNISKILEQEKLEPR